MVQVFTGLELTALNRFKCNIVLDISRLATQSLPFFARKELSASRARYRVGRLGQLGPGGEIEIAKKNSQCII